jgi:transposase InsO family protein
MAERKKPNRYTISEMCRLLKVSRQGYYQYLEGKKRPDKHAELLAVIQAILDEDEENASYGRKRMIDALRLKGRTESDSTIYRVLRKNGLLQKTHTPKGLTVADKAAHKNDNLLKRDFTAQAPSEKLVSDITQLPTADGTLYISGVFDCYDNSCLSLSMDDNMKTPLVMQSLASAHNRYGIAGAVFHTDRGSQYTSDEFRACLHGFGVIQSMNSDGGRCHDNAKCESMWARFKTEAIYGRRDTSKMPMEDVKTLVFRYFLGYWNNRRICHAIGGVPPAVKRDHYYANLLGAA